MYKWISTYVLCVHLHIQTPNLFPICKSPVRRHLLRINYRPILLFLSIINASEQSSLSISDFFKNRLRRFLLRKKKVSKGNYKNREGTQWLRASRVIVGRQSPRHHHQPLSPIHVLPATSRILNTLMSSSAIDLPSLLQHLTLIKPLTISPRASNVAQRAGRGATAAGVVGYQVPAGFPVPQQSTQLLNVYFGIVLFSSQRAAEPSDAGPAARWTTGMQPSANSPNPNRDGTSDMQINIPQQWHAPVAHKH